MTNMVADMFKDTLGKDDPNFIGLQKPGGTRASLLDKDITYKQAAQVLPFANTLTTTRITGAQFKKVLEQQWQRAGTARSRHVHTCSSACPRTSPTPTMSPARRANASPPCG
ncbi:5'-nucleotidase [Cutibacterium acnes]